MVAIAREAPVEPLADVLKRVGVHGTPVEGLRHALDPHASIEPRVIRLQQLQHGIQEPAGMPMLAARAGDCLLPQIGALDLRQHPGQVRGCCRIQQVREEPLLELKEVVGKASQVLDAERYPAQDEDRLDVRHE
jgi:hypothetical protein